ncbi:MAG: hypothetical protein COB40_04630 [Marinosulfonomonas sp.]|nr:MAG: hypothetical protein COB40_04630 [Marinosulfonomonas sp.]
MKRVIILFSFNKFTWAALVSGLFITFALPVTASTVTLDIGGPSDGVEAIGPTTAYAGAAATFSVNSALTNASLNFDLFCLSRPCAGTVFLTKSTLGPTGSIVGLLAGSQFSGGAGTYTAFSGLNLAVGTYSVVVQISQGFSGWIGSQSPTFLGDGRVTHVASSLISSLNPNYAPTSVFTPLTSYTLGYVLSANAAIAPVPLPATGLLLFGAVGLIGAARRKRKAL